MQDRIAALEAANAVALVLLAKWAGGISLDVPIWSVIVAVLQAQGIADGAAMRVGVERAANLLAEASSAFGNYPHAPTLAMN